jgi:hypothetical protein
MLIDEDIPQSFISGIPVLIFDKKLSSKFSFAGQKIYSKSPDKL